MKPARDAGDGPANGVPGALGRLLGEALRCLEDTNLDGANAALRKALAACTEGDAARVGHERGDGSRDPGREQGPLAEKGPVDRNARNAVRVRGATPQGGRPEEMTRPGEATPL